MLEEHEGGEKFFDNLDSEVLKEPILETLISSVKGQHKFAYAIVSGKFGTFFHNYLATKNSDKRIYVVEGGLRKTQTLDLTYMKDSIIGNEFIFLDDSYYLGRTRDTIKKEIERLGGTLIHTYVIYDGSKGEDESVSNLYKYFSR